MKLLISLSESVGRICKFNSNSKLGYLPVYVTS